MLDQDDVFYCCLFMSPGIFYSKDSSWSPLLMAEGTGLIPINLFTLEFTMLRVLGPFVKSVVRFCSPYLKPISSWDWSVVILLSLTIYFGTDYLMPPSMLGDLSLFLKKLRFELPFIIMTFGN